MTVTIRHGDCREVLRTMPDESVHCCVTSPPYFGLRDYGVEGQIGLESTPEMFVEEMVLVFRELRRVLRPDGTLWLNLGDSYSGSGKGGNPEDSPHKKQATNAGSLTVQGNFRPGSNRADGKVDHGLSIRNRNGILCPPGLKPKDLIGIPWQVALALRADGWWLRQDIIWSKPNPMPESVTDRCTKAHEYLFLLSKSQRYHYDAEAIAEPVTTSTVDRLSQPNLANQAGSDRVPGKTNGRMKAVGSVDKGGGDGKTDFGMYSGRAGDRPDGLRNRRSVWEVTTQPFTEAHFATFPPALIEPCIKAGCPEGGTVLDPFGGAGTTGLVADRLQRNAILIELNPEYAAMAERRIRGDAGMFASVSSSQRT